MWTLFFFPFICSAFASLPDDSKKKLLKKFEDKGKFHSLYKSVQAISTDNALKLYSVHLLQNDKQFNVHLKGNPQESSSTSAGEDSNSLPSRGCYITHPWIFKNQVESWGLWLNPFSPFELIGIYEVSVWVFREDKDEGESSSEV